MFVRFSRKGVATRRCPYLSARRYEECRVCDSVRVREPQQWDVLAFNSKVSVRRYLEYVINDLQAVSEGFHTELALAYLEIGKSVRMLCDLWATA
jgi:hypothetical protein